MAGDDADVSIASQVEYLKNQRSGIKGRITFFKNQVDKNKAKITESELQSIHNRLASIYAKFDATQSELEQLDSDQLATEIRDSFETDYGALEALVLDLIKSRQKPSVQINTETANVLSTQSKTQLAAVRLPDIKLPSFNGDHENWLKFRSSYLDLIHNNPLLSNSSKYHYLLSCLNEGKAYQLIASLPISGDNYTTAWDTLEQEYNNEVRIIKKHMRNIYDISKVQENSVSSLRTFIESFWRDYRALLSLKQPVNQWDLFLTHHLACKLDVESLKEVEQKSPLNEMQTITKFMEILSQRLQVLEATIVNIPGPAKRQPMMPSVIERSRRVLVSTSSGCPICKQSHSVFKCSSFMAMTVNECHNLVKRRNLCVNCLNASHDSKMCHYGSCRVCHRRHHTLLHQFVAQQPDSKQSSTKNVQVHSSSASFDIADITSVPAVISAPTHNVNSQVLLATAIVNICDASGQVHQCRALLDSASMSNFMTERLAQKLRLHRNNLSIPVNGIGGKQNLVKYSVLTNLQSRLSSFNVTLTCLLMPKITGKLPLYEIDINRFNLPSDIKQQLADPLFCHPDEIDLLIGAEVYSDIVYNQRLIIHQELPKLVSSAFGYLLMGKMPVSVSSHVSTVSLLTTLDELSSQLKKFWELESVDSSKNMSLEENECEKMFIETTTRTPEGRYIVTLPTRPNIHNLGDSVQTALRQFLRLERILAKNGDFKDLYTEFMREYIQLGHMQMISSSSVSELPCYYLPHHGVVKPSSTTTKLRVVFNASSNTGVSLNDALKIGATIQQDLFSILSRFRTHKYVIKADVAKMYRQVQLNNKQRCLQRILWRSDPSEPIQTYELCTVTYGTASAAFLATRALKQVALDEIDVSSEASEKVITDFYIDDLLTGASTIDDAKQLQRDISTLLARGCFPLRKWVSNHPDVLADITQSHQESSTIVNLLGLLWSTSQDTFSVPSENIKVHSKPTKRSVLSTISSIFDPLGLFSPVTFMAKCFMQNLWSQPDIDWDDVLPSTSLSSWEILCKELKLVSQASIPRCVISVDPADMVQIQIHGFGDASERGYGCAVYIRTSDRSGNNYVHLLGSKSRVAPIKKTTIPRLELCASLLLSQLTKKVISCLNIKFNRIFLWTDSEITLYRIKSPSSKFVTFVANRIAQIQELTSSDDWFFVASSENPADIVSRGCLTSQLLASNIWWNGPKFLTNSEHSWPQQKKFNIDESQLETKREQATIAVTSYGESEWLYRFSDFRRLVRFVAIWLRYFDNLVLPKKQRKTEGISALEFERALKRIVRIVQLQTFSGEIRNLRTQKMVSRKSTIYNLTPFLDSHGILRVGGRLKNADHLPYDQKFPMLLPGKHYFSGLLVRHEHQRSLHSGPRALLNQLRQRFWLTSAQGICKRVCRQCISCFRTKPISAEQLMGDLPNYRVQPARSFVNVGVDFCGPFPITQKIRGRSPIKMYLAIFVCLTTKAVHIELVEDLTTQAFIAALRCFVSRRGHPANIFCDNATNFRGACNELQEIQRMVNDHDKREEIQRFCTNEHIQWHMIPARSPHVGGIWEAAVKMAKAHLKRTVGLQILTASEFRVLATQIEACLNSRPLTEDSTSSSDLAALTPGHFLIHAPLTAVIDPDLSQLNINRLSRWQLVQHITQTFWKRWSSEYLSSHQQRAKWNIKHKNLAIGTLVLLKEANLPPQKWILGRISATFPGTDGLVRIVQVKTRTGTFTRSIVKVCPLPIDDNVSTEQKVLE